jgi:hypothetical protein
VTRFERNRAALVDELAERGFSISERERLVSSNVATLAILEMARGLTAKAAAIRVLQRHRLPLDRKPAKP